MLVSPKQNCAVGGLSQRQISCRLWQFRLRWVAKADADFGGIWALHIKDVLLVYLKTATCIP